MFTPLPELYQASPARHAEKFSLQLLIRTL